MPDVRVRRGVGIFLACTLVLWAGPSWSGEPTDKGTSPPAAPELHSDARAVVDRVVVRFFAPEMGGVTHPHFITERTLAFEARLEAMSENGPGKSQVVDERQLQSALDRHVAEDLLATLDATSNGLTVEEARLAREARADLEQRVGGENPIYLAAEEEGLDGDEVQAVFTRRARAAAYLDRTVSRFLHPQDAQLREVYRTSLHPFRDRPYDDVRLALSRWLVFEHLKALESTFLQTARSRVTVVVVPR